MVSHENYSALVVGLRGRGVRGLGGYSQREASGFLKPMCVQQHSTTCMTANTGAYEPCSYFSPANFLKFFPIQL